MTPFQAKKILRDAGADVEGDKTAVMERLNSILRRSGAAQDSSPLVDSQSASIAVAGSARPVQSKALDSLPLPQQAAVEAVQSGEVNSMSPFKLKKLLRDNTLEVNGSKAELKARLEAFVGTVAGQEQDANGDNSRNEQSGDDSAGAAEAVAAAAESEDDTASTEVMTAAAFSPGGAPGGDSEELLNIPATITRTTSGAGPATPPPEDDEEAEDPDALKGNLVAASLDLGERLAGKDVRVRCPALVEFCTARNNAFFLKFGACFTVRRLLADYGKGRVNADGRRFETQVRWRNGKGGHERCICAKRSRKRASKKSSCAKRARDSSCEGAAASSRLVDAHIEAVLSRGIAKVYFENAVQVEKSSCLTILARRKAELHSSGQRALPKAWMWRSRQRLQQQQSTDWAQW